MLESSLATNVEDFASMPVSLKQYLNHEKKKPTMKKKYEWNYG